ncbi:hypothetical protein GJV06_15785 [Enterobacteriaceae bacterium RIT691]|nr:hypothetical protein [Enterobacteriaceae bacterium RIT691]
MYIATSIWGGIFIVNSCDRTIQVLADNYTSSISPVGGGNTTQIELSTPERKAVAVFTLARSDRNIAYLFSEQGADFQIKISDGKKDKIFRGQEIYRLSKKVTTREERKDDFVFFEINSKEICP